MTDRTDSGQGRDALDAAIDALREAILMPFNSTSSNDECDAAYLAARAAVRQAAKEMGEVFTVDRVYGQAVIHVGADGQFFDKGDRVRVVKVES